MLSGKRPRNNYGGPVNLTIYQYLAGCTKYYTLSAISTYIFNILRWYGSRERGIKRVIN
jgi:hypothetical protein